MRRATTAGAVLLVAVAALVGCGSAGPSGPPRLAFGPASALFDTPLTATVSDVDPCATVTLTLTSSDAGGVGWRSSATYTADRSGSVTLDSPATGGAYTGVSPSGLVDALHPTSGATPRTMAVPDDWRMTLTATAGGRDVGTATVRRLLTAQVGVRTTTLTLATDGLVGEMAEPADTSTTGPAVVVWGGSEGGLSTGLYARALAAHGYPALALAYFDEPGLPKTLTDIPMEYFAEAVTYLDGRPGVDPSKVAVSGYSRGGEAALLLAVERPDLVHAVIATSASDVVYGDYPSTGQAGWTYRGEPVPFAPIGEFGSSHPAQTDAIIPTERFPGPILMACGGSDQVYDACGFATAVTERRRSDPPTVVRDENSGHFIGSAVPYLPYPDALAAGATFDGFGGTAVDNGHGRAVLWPPLLAFVAAVP